MIGFAVETIGTGAGPVADLAALHGDQLRSSTRRVGGILVVAIVIGLANALVKPVLKILSLPFSLMTLGLSGLIVNAVVLLGVAWVTEQLKITSWSGTSRPRSTRRRSSPPFIGAVVLSVVSLAIGLLPFMKTSR